jgi:transcriptional regulator with XRE-family HTH domain
VLVFAEYLARALEDRRWSKRQAGLYLGVSDKQIDRYLKGAQPTLPVAVKLAARLGVTVDELAGVSRLEPQQQPRQVVLLIDGEPWIAHAERRTEVRSQWETAAGERPGLRGRSRPAITAARQAKRYPMNSSISATTPQSVIP